MPCCQTLNTLYEAFLLVPHHPVYLIGGLVLISFLVEDVAAAAGVALATAGSLTWSESFLAVWFGIAIGDLLLYAAGYFSRQMPILKRRFVDGVTIDGAKTQKSRLAGTVFVARVVPGLRLVSYVYLGLKQVNFLNFTLLVMIAVLIWTASLYAGSIYLGEFIAMSLPIPKVLAVSLPLLSLAIITLIFSWIKRKWHTA